MWVLFNCVCPYFFVPDHHTQKTNESESDGKKGQLVTFSSIPVLGQSCPEKDGRYPSSTCDGYIECKDGIPEEKLCPDGLLFNPASGPQAFPCQYPIDVDCSGREQTRNEFFRILKM